MNIGQRIRELRRAKKYTITALAEIIGVRREYLSNLERNVNTPSLPTLQKICEALNVTLAEFFSTKDDVMPPEHRELLQNIKHLTPEQLKLLNEFLKSLRK